MYLNSHNNDDGLCVQAKVDGDEAVWLKTNCASSNTKGLVCARRHNWEDIGNVMLCIAKFPSCTCKHFQVAEHIFYIIGYI